MEHFQNDDAGYTRWTIDHYGRGFVLHRAGPGEFTIHRAGCGHIYDDAADYKLTGKEKICDESEVELRAYVREQGGRSLANPADHEPAEELSHRPRCEHA